MMGVIASEAKQYLHFKHEIATACFAGLAMTTTRIMCDEALETYEKFLWVVLDNRSISSAEISENTIVAIHKAFWRTLGIRNR